MTETAKAISLFFPKFSKLIRSSVRVHEYFRTVLYSLSAQTRASGFESELLVTVTICLRIPFPVRSNQAWTMHHIPSPGGKTEQPKLSQILVALKKKLRACLENGVFHCVGFIFENLWIEQKLFSKHQTDFGGSGVYSFLYFFLFFSVVLFFLWNIVLSVQILKMSWG